MEIGILRKAKLLQHLAQPSAKPLESQCKHFQHPLPFRLGSRGPGQGRAGEGRRRWACISAPSGQSTALLEPRKLAEPHPGSICPPALPVPCSGWHHCPKVYTPAVPGHRAPGLSTSSILSPWGARSPMPKAPGNPGACPGTQGPGSPGKLLPAPAGDSSPPPLLTTCSWSFCRSDRPSVYTPA